MYFDLACKQIYFPPGKCINGRNESKILDFLGALKTEQVLCCTDDINQHSFIIVFPLLKTTNTNLSFPFEKRQPIIYHWKHFTCRNGNSKQEEIGSIKMENCEEHPRSKLAQNSYVPRSQEGYIIQVSEEIEGRVTKKLSQECSRTENRILGALARLDDLLMYPLVQGHCGTVPETSRNLFIINQGTNGDDSQSDPHPEVGIFNNQTTRNSGPEDGHDTQVRLYIRLSYIEKVRKWQLYPIQI